MASRSYLYVPGNDAEKLEKAINYPADAIIADLEDSVPEDQKATGRDIVASWLDQIDSSRRQFVWVRVNTTEHQPADLRATVRAGLAGIVAPKAELASVASLTRRLEATEKEASITTPLSILPLIETAVGVAEASRIAAYDRVHRIGMGEADLTAELGLEVSINELELLPLRTAVVLASSAARLGPPVASTSTHFGELRHLQASTARLKRLGFFGRTAIHPSQLEVINAVFAPSNADVEEARRIVALYHQALAEGRGTIADDHGRMIDEAIAKRALLTLEHASDHSNPHESAS